MNPVPGYVRELVLNAILITAAAWLIRRPASRWSLDTVLGLHVDETDLDLDERDDDEHDRDDAHDRDDRDEISQQMNGVQP